MKRLDLLALLVWLLFGSLSCVQAATYYVDQKSTSSQSAQDGSEQRPFRTFGPALAIAKAGDTVLIRPGVYTDPIVLTRSGTKLAPITLQATRRHGVTVSGATTLLQSDPGISYITVRGIVFHDTRKDIYKIAGYARSGWKVEDCIFEGGGLDARLDDNAQTRAVNVTFLRVICQETWGCGMSAQGVNGFLVKDCVIRRCNRSGEHVADSTAGSKVFNTDRCRVENLVSYDNVGAGWWFDFQNTHFEITGGTFFGNHGVNAENQAGGIWLEKNSDGHVAHNLIYSNDGSGISIWSMENLVVEDNTFVDNLTTLWRAQGLDSKGGERLWNIVLRNNRIKSWRRDAHSISAWEVVNIKNVTIDGNIYDPPEGRPLWFWWGKEGKRIDLFSLNEVRQVLGFETHGSVAKIPFDRSLFATKHGLEVQLGKEGEHASIDEGLERGAAKVGTELEIPVQGRSDIQRLPNGEWETEVYDLGHNRHVRLTIKSAQIRSALEKGISRFAMWTPVGIRVRVTQRDEYDVRAIALGGPHTYQGR